MPRYKEIVNVLFCYFLFFIDWYKAINKRPLVEHTSPTKRQPAAVLVSIDFLAEGKINTTKKPIINSGKIIMRARRSD